MIPSGRLDDGFHEVVAIVSDAEASARRLCAAWGYQRLWSGPAAPDAARLMGVGAGAVEILIGDASQQRGFLRLVEFPGARNGLMRDGGQAWDAGGIFDINLRPRTSIEAVHRAMTHAGFVAFAPITAYDFTSFQVKEVVSRDSDGIGVAVIEQTVPRFEFSMPSSATVSYIFNSTQVVRSREEARALYVDAFGWRTVFETAWAHPGAGLNCLGLPLDIARDRLIRVGVYQSNGLNQGSVEVLEVEGEGLDFSDASPPDRGIASLRFPVSDLDAFLGAARKGGCRIVPVSAFSLEPYGLVSAGAAVTPWGVRLEAYSPQS